MGWWRNALTLIAPPCPVVDADNARCSKGWAPAPSNDPKQRIIAHGLDFQAELVGAQIDIPIIFLTGHGDIPMSVKAMKAGAVEFLTKPVRSRICSMPSTWPSNATASARERREDTYAQSPLPIAQ